MVLLAATAGRPAAAQAPDRRVAITFDDLVMTPEAGGCDPAVARMVNARILAGLERAGVLGTGFVNASRTCGLPPERLRNPVLEWWLDAGHLLGNHTWSHPDLEDTELQAYLADAKRGGAALDSLLARRGRSVEWFRHPQLHAGDTPEKKRGLSRFLEQQGWRVAPVTVDNQEYVYAYVYHTAVRHGEASLAARVADAFLEHIDGAFAYFERRSREVVGREIPQVLLLHANRLVADHIDEVLARIQARGYEVVSLAEVVKDPAYERGDPWMGRGGPSWIERWAVAGGGEARRGPREDEWVAEEFGRMLRQRRDGAEPSGRSAEPDATPESAIAAASRAFSKAYVAGDTATIRSLYTEDAVLLPPGGEVIGAAAVARYFAPGSRSRTLAHSMHSEEIRVTGPVAVDRGTWRHVVQDAGGRVGESSERYLIVWRLGADDRWRIHYDMWHRPDGD